MKLRFSYAWLLPVIWVGITIASFFHSGDEHGCFAIGVIVFMWLSIVFGQFNSLLTFLLYVLPIGIIIIGLAGFLMDRLRVSRKLLFGLSVVGFVLFLWLFVRDFESLQALRYKHRSILAPIFLAANIGLYFGILLSVVISLIQKLTGKKMPALQSE